MKAIEWCNRIIRSGFYLLFFLVPLILTPWNYELFEFNKMILTYGTAVIVVTAWIAKMLFLKKIQIKRTILDVPLFLFLLSQLISSLFSMDPHISWFGYYSRFNGGMLSLFTYVFLYYTFVSNWSNTPDSDDHNQAAIHPKHIIFLLMVSLVSAVIVSFYGILERFGMSPSCLLFTGKFDVSCWVQDVKTRVFATLGQPNWMAAYLVALIPVSWSLALLSFAKSKKGTFVSSSIIWIFVSFILFIATLSTRSRSGVLALAIATVVFVFGVLIKTDKKSHLKVPLILIGLFFGLTVFFNGTYITQIDQYVTYQSLQARLQPKKEEAKKEQKEDVPAQTAMEFGGTESGTIRQFVWQAAITAWRSSTKAFFIGTGTETFAFAFFKYKPLEHNMTSEWDFLYNKAHNEYLNYLTTTGILGLGAYTLFLGMFIAWVLKQTVKRDTDNSQTLEVGLFAGWISMLVTNFFGFSVVIIQIFLFLFPAFIFSLSKKDSKSYIFSLSNIPRKASVLLLMILFGISTVGIIFVAVMWTGDFYFSRGFRFSRTGKVADSYRSLTQATLLRPDEPQYYDELATTLSSLAIASMEAGDATGASSLAEQSLLASDKTLAISPNNVNYWKTRTKIYFSFANVDPKFVQASIDALEKAYALSPKDPKITYNLAVLYGRLGQNEKAIELLAKSIQLKPNYRDPYYALSVFYQEVKQPNMAKEILKTYLDKVDPNDQDFQDKLKQI